MQVESGKRPAAALLALCTLCLLCLPAGASGTDYAMIMPKASTSLLLDIAAAGERLVAVGERGHIVYSDDDGENWTQAQVPTSVMLTRVFFLDDSQGWAVGHDGHVLFTRDAGTNWELQRDGLADQARINEERAGRARETVDQLRQALASSTSFGTPRRTILGLDQNRVALLTAVMEKKLGMHLMGHDIFMNVAGGVKVDEPAVDLGIISAIASSFLDKPLPEGSVVLGEVGLTGEVRAIGQVDIRAAEIRKMGFSRCLVPFSNLKRMPDVDGLELVGVKTVEEAIENLF